MSESRLDVSLISPKNVLKKQQLTQDLLVHLRAKILEYPASHNLKGCSEFLLYCCKIVENVVVKKQKIDKKELVKEVFKQLFNLSPAELLALDSAIQFLFDNNLICKVARSKKVVRFFKKKVSCLF